MFSKRKWFLILYNDIEVVYWEKKKDIVESSNGPWGYDVDSLEEGVEEDPQAHERLLE